MPHSKSRGSKWIAITGVVVLLALLTVVPALAQSGDNADQVINENVEDDLYLFGRNITVNADVDGDLLVIGGSLALNGTVNGDLIFVGQSLVMSGTITDDARAAGGVLAFEDGSSVGDDLVSASYALEMRPGSKVGGDVKAAAAQVVLNDVTGDVQTDSAGLRINGLIGGDVEAHVGSSSDLTPFNPFQFQSSGIPTPDISPMSGGLTFGSQGKIAGKLNYFAPQEAAIPSGAVSGAPTFTLVQTTQETQGASLPAWVHYAGYFFGSFLLLLGLGALLHHFAPTFLNGSLETLRKRTWASLGVGILGMLAYWGLLILVVLLLFILVLPLTMVGGAQRFFSALTLVGMGAFTGFEFLTRWIAPLLVALALGELLYGLLYKEQKSFFLSLLIGLTIVLLILAIPFFGKFLLAGVVAAFGLGAVILHLWPKKAAEAAAPTPAAGK